MLHATGCVAFWKKEETGADHQLHVLDVPEEVCIARLRARNAQGDHPFVATEEQFRQLSKHFVAPTPDEGFNIVLHHPQESALDTKTYGHGYKDSALWTKSKTITAQPKSNLPLFLRSLMWVNSYCRW